jgi:hypothetical protein
MRTRTLKEAPSAIVERMAAANPEHCLLSACLEAMPAPAITLGEVDTYVAVSCSRGCVAELVEDCTDAPASLRLSMVARSIRPFCSWYYVVRTHPGLIIVDSAWSVMWDRHHLWVDCVSIDVLGYDLDLLPADIVEAVRKEYLARHRMPPA